MIVERDRGDQVDDLERPRARPRGDLERPRGDQGISSSVLDGRMSGCARAFRYGAGGSFVLEAGPGVLEANIYAGRRGDVPCVGVGVRYAIGVWGVLVCWCVLRWVFWWDRALGPPSVSVDRRPTICGVCWLVVSAPSLGPSFLGHDSEALLTGDAHACKAWPQRFDRVGVPVGATVADDLRRL